MTSTADRALSDPFARITRQNHRLLQAIQKDNFDGFIRLDPTLNQAVTLIHAANEDIVRYPQGSFPLHAAYPMVYSTLHLLKACEKRYGRVKVKAMYQAFCKLFRLWFYAGAPRCPSEIFAKKIFEGEDQLFSAICEHNRSIEEVTAPQPAPKRRRTSRRLPPELTQDMVANDFGVSRKQISKWETEATEDGPNNKSNKYGYYPSLRTNPDLRGAYNQLVQVVRLYRRQAEEAKAKGRRAITFVAFNEAYHKRRQ